MKDDFTYDVKVSIRKLWRATAKTRMQQTDRSIEEAELDVKAAKLAKEIEDRLNNKQSLQLQSNKGE
jgi:hypothetical protein